MTRGNVGKMGFKKGELTHLKTTSDLFNLFIITINTSRMFFFLFRKNGQRHKAREWRWVVKESY